MKSSRVSLALFAALAVSASAAHAETFSFSFGAPTDIFAGMGTLTGTQVTADPGFVAEYLITDIAGTTRTTRNGGNRVIASLDAPGTSFGNDNLLFFDGTNYMFDANGLSYTLRNGADINLFNSFGTDMELLIRANGNLVAETTPINIAPTPEPGSFALMGTGLLGVAGMMRRRFAA